MIAVRRTVTSLGLWSPSAILTSPRWFPYSQDSTQRSREHVLCGRRITPPTQLQVSNRLPS